MSKYISQIDGHKSSIVFTYLQDMQTIYECYLKGSICLDSAISQVSRLLYYLKGFLFGLGIKHQNQYVHVDNNKLEYVSFYNNASHSIKYSVCICLDRDNFGVKYNRINKKGV